MGFDFVECWSMCLAGNKQVTLLYVTYLGYILQGNQFELPCSQ
ncbi:hypothetical protein AALB_3100 [Agarivorans albus MKT 106]|uniref:Uncharacterized protein n=1 Tax=Agarivorans albus MKT 106 TaxID=1331007 RepID=R9PNY8_AGAAL|nr:hypothetical protein AALB_3100 [Agarivorans albus MKT 106]